MKSTAGAREIDRAYRQRFRPANDWEDEMVKRLVLDRWANEQHRKPGEGRLPETFLKRSSNALQTLVAMRKRREEQEATKPTPKID